MTLNKVAMVVVLCAHGFYYYYIMRVIALCSIQNAPLTISVEQIVKMNFVMAISVSIMFMLNNISVRHLIDEHEKT